MCTRITIVLNHRTCSAHETNQQHNLSGLDLHNSTLIVHKSNGLLFADPAEQYSARQSASRSGQKDAISWRSDKGAAIAWLITQTGLQNAPPPPNTRKLDEFWSVIRRAGRFVFKPNKLSKTAKWQRGTRWRLFFTLY